MVQQYRERSEKVEAFELKTEHWNPSIPNDLPQWFIEATHQPEKNENSVQMYQKDGRRYANVRTCSCIQEALIGDWIVKTSKGLRRYTASGFMMQYELIEEPEPEYDSQDEIRDIEARIVHSYAHILRS